MDMPALGTAIEVARESLRQVVEGADFSPPAKVLKSIKAESAVAVLPGMPYSLATNVAHADLWNRLWLARLEGLPKFKPFPDFFDVSQEEWPTVRELFLNNLMRAHQIACAEPFVHHCESDPAALRLLLKIATHSSYHVGQITLLKRALRVKG